MDRGAIVLMITFQGESMGELRKAFRDTVEDNLDFCRRRNGEPNKPFSGNFVLRISPELHQKLYKLVNSSGKSLNSLIEESLEALQYSGGI